MEPRSAGIDSRYQKHGNHQYYVPISQRQLTHREEPKTHSVLRPLKRIRSAPIARKARPIIIRLCLRNDAPGVAERRVVAVCVGPDTPCFG